MTVTVYTISQCPFCKAEKEYLAANRVQFTEKNLETNREWLTEMLEVSDKFAGVPFTHIKKDDGTEVKLKGFTKSEFDEALGFTAPATASSNVSTTAADGADVIASPGSVGMAQSSPSVAPTTDWTQTPASVNPTVPTITPPPSVTPAPTDPNTQKLGSLLDSLQQKSAPVNQSAPVAPQAAPPASVPSVTPATPSTTPATPTPTIPDFSVN